MQNKWVRECLWTASQWKTKKQTSSTITSIKILTLALFYQYSSKAILCFLLFWLSVIFRSLAVHSTAHAYVFIHFDIVSENLYQSNLLSAFASVSFCYLFTCSFITITIADVVHLWIFSWISAKWIPNCTCNR